MRAFEKLNVCCPKFIHIMLPSFKNGVKKTKKNTHSHEWMIVACKMQTYYVCLMSKASYRCPHEANIFHLIIRLTFKLYKATYTPCFACTPTNGFVSTCHNIICPWSWSISVKKVRIAPGLVFLFCLWVVGFFDIFHPQKRYQTLFLC